MDLALLLIIDLVIMYSVREMGIKRQRKFSLYLGNIGIVLTVICMTVYIIINILKCFLS
nr:hypothetical protein [uncultured Clostridium sp.]